MTAKISGGFINGCSIARVQSAIGLLKDEESRKIMLEFLKLVRTSHRKKPAKNLKYRYEIVFKIGAIEDIKKIKGWKTDSEFAEALDLTRAYVCLLKNRKAACTQTVITRVAACLGNTEGSWWQPFEIKETGFYNAGDPLWNKDKYDGRQPYEAYSSNGNMRKLDYAAEIKER